MTLHTRAQAARIAVTRKVWGLGKGRRRKFEPASIAHVQSNGPMGPLVKVLDTRSLIDDAMRRRAIAQADT